MKQVSMKVNQANLVKSLKFSFTNKTTVLAELMQNARRANATHVVFEFAPETRILRITDDGCGIDSIETLLTVAESGWNADVVAQEHPFGIGFLSALFACRHMTVVSKSGRMSVNTDDVLSFKPVTVSPATDWDGITSIVMSGVDLDLFTVEEELKRLASAFPIPVLFNGTSLARPHAIDSGLDFVSTEIGSVCLAGFDEPASYNKCVVMYLQGLPIYKSHNSSSYGSRRGDHVIHLDSSQFFGRLPDRDELVDKREVVKRVDNILKCAIETRLNEMKATISPEAFVAYFDLINDWNLLSVLNDVPVVPREVLCEITGYPHCSEESFGECETRPEKPVFREELVSGRQVVSFEEYMQDDGSALSMYVFKKGFYVYGNSRHQLDSAHWLHNHIRNLNDETIHIELIDQTHEANFEGQWVCLDAVFCDAYRIFVGDDSIVIDDDSMFDGTRAIVPKKDGCGTVVTQSNSFRDDYDFQQSAYETDEYDFSQFVVANTSSDPTIALMRLIPSFRSCPSVYGKSFVISLDENGCVASVTAA